MNLKLIIVALLTFSTSLSFAQDCSKFYPFSEGTISEISMFDKKGKPSGFITYHVLKVVSSEGTEIATLSSTFKDRKGKLISSQEFDASCNGDLVSFDFKSLMNPQILEQYKDMEYDISGVNLEFPNDLSVGQDLPDANIEMIISMNGINITMNIITKDRTVAAREDITTSAGTFDCYVVTYTSEMKMSMGMNQTFKGKQWIAEDVGMVKQEDYNKNGKLTGSSLLTAFNQ
jgi:hypothetical protein